MSESKYREGRTDGPMKCPWFPGSEEKSPHLHYRPKRNKISATVLEAIGDTPLVRLDKIAKEEGLECELLAKCEFFNAGGSVKDRIGKRMVEDAERDGRLKPGMTIIEPTSGNTGIGLALCAAIKGYRCIITMPEKMSQEKVNVLKALGAEIVRTPTSAAWDAPDSHIGVALRLNKEIEGSIILDQYVNPANPLAHYDGTGAEILEACDDKVDMVVAGAGTGGTITGIARKVKERCPSCIVVGVDPHGSILAEPQSLNEEFPDAAYQVEGIGYDFIPTVLDRSIVDKWYKVHDKPALIMSRRLIATEGLLVGGSAGCAVHSAIKACKDAGLGKGQRCVVVLSDSTRNYMTKFLSDEWMWRMGFVDEARKIGTVAVPTEWWASSVVRDLAIKTPFTITGSVTCKEAVDIMAKEGFDQLPVLGDDANVLGVVTGGNLAAKLAAGKVLPSDPVTGALYTQFVKVDLDTSLATLSAYFNKDHFALVIQEQKLFAGADKPTTSKSVVLGVVSRIDLLSYISKGTPAATPRGGGGTGAGEAKAE